MFHILFRPEKPVEGKFYGHPTLGHNLPYGTILYSDLILNIIK